MIFYPSLKHYEANKYTFTKPECSDLFAGIAVYESSTTLPNKGPFTKDVLSKMGPLNPPPSVLIRPLWLTPPPPPDEDVLFG